MNLEIGSFHIQHEQRSFPYHLRFFSVSTGALFQMKWAFVLWKRVLYVFRTGPCSMKNIFYEKYFFNIFILSITSAFSRIIQGPSTPNIQIHV